ncbi:MAG TPA: lanthionine synthetase LanC family protein [Caulobacteraceae bacterium]|nr:lanthionine synthetase LanC family protein [Caulobacteraceae bacterium]
MADYLTPAREALAFIASQRLAGRTKWRREAGAEGSDYSLYHGSAGIALLLLELHRQTGEAALLDEAVAAGEEIAAHLARVERLSVSVATGWPGYAFAMAELARASGREDFRALAGQCLARLRAQAADLGAGIGWIEPMPFSDITGMKGDREIFDQSVGAAGAGLVFLYGHREGLHPDCLAWAKATADRLLEVAEPTAEGLRWRMMSDMPFAFTAPNFAHGGAGVGYFLAELFKVTGDERYRDAAVQAARYTLSRAHPAGPGKLVCHTEEARNPIFYLGACHGPAGTGRLLLALAEITGDTAWVDEAGALMRGLEHTGAPEARSKGLWNNHGQCCGDAGVGEFALLMARRTGDERYRRLAERCADVILAASTAGEGGRRWVQAEHRDRPTFLQAQTGYMQGAAGIASFLVHLASLETARPAKIALPDWPAD